MSLEFRYSELSPFKPASLEEIKELEKKINNELPLDFKNFLIKHNGGSPSKSLFFIKKNIINTTNFKTYDSNLIIIESFSKIKNIISFGLRTYNNEKMIYIGNGTVENLFYISLSPKSYGSILYWDYQETPEEFDSYDFDNPENDNLKYENIYFVCNSFKEFIESLVDE
jgi:hypothetical protein